MTVRRHSPPLLPPLPPPTPDHSDPTLDSTGIDVFDSKFNVVSPGCDTDTYFPFSDESKRLTSAQRYIADLLYGDEQADVTVGKLVERKPIIFSMARLDAVKNLTGLANIYGNSPTLRDRCNLVIIGGVRYFVCTVDARHDKSLNTNPTRPARSSIPRSRIIKKRWPSAGRCMVLSNDIG